MPSALPALLVSLAVALLGTRAASQLQPGHYAVLTRATAGVPQALVYDVDPTNGVATPLPRFLFDHHEPLAVATDPANGDVLVALYDRTNDFSMVQRLQLRRGRIAGSRGQGSVSGRITALGFGAESLLYAAAVDAQGRGYCYSIERYTLRPGFVRLIANPTEPSAMQIYPRGTTATLAHAATTPEISAIDLTSGGTFLGPVAMPSLRGQRITGVSDLPTGAIRHAITSDRGRVFLLEFLSQPREITTSPALAPDATACSLGVGLEMIAVGGTGTTDLIRIPVFGSQAGQWSRIASGMAGDPVGVAATRWPGPGVEPFGENCTIGGSLGWRDAPRLGSSAFAMTLNGAQRGAPALFMLGLDDHRVTGGLQPLPTLVRGCLLHVSPDFAIPATTSSVGGALAALPIPNDPNLDGLVLFTQWWVAWPPQGVSGASNAAAIWLGR